MSCTTSPLLPALPAAPSTRPHGASLRAALTAALLVALVAAAALVPVAPADAAEPACRPCAGALIDDPAALAALLASGDDPLRASAEDEDDDDGENEETDENGPEPGPAPFTAAWTVRLDGVADASATPSTPATARAVADASRALVEAGARPWVRLEIAVSAPLADHEPTLAAALEEAAAVARSAAPGTTFQVVWTPPAGGDGDPDPASTAFLLKRASVALTGAAPGASVVSGPWPADPAVLEALYAEDVAPYVDGIALAPAPAERLAAAVEALDRLDPGRHTVVDAVAFPTEPTRVLAEAGRAAAAGVDLVLFDLPRPDRPSLAPLVVLARQFAGDVSYDPAAAPDGAEDAWVFVRGEDLALRVIVDLGPSSDADDATGTGTEPVDLVFPDPLLQRPERVLFDGRPGVEPLVEPEIQPLFGARRGETTYTVPLDPSEAAGSVQVLRLERAMATDLEAIDEEVTVADERGITVEEILRRLQAFEDAQERKLDHFQAVNTTHLRFGAGAGVGTVEVTFEGAFFFRQGLGFDWAWEDFLINGVRWRGDTIPEIPLIQPEKAAVLPLEITFSRQYDYRLVGEDTIDGRPAWEVEFTPSATSTETDLYRGRLWVDRETFARLRTRAVQLGLEGEVLSNEEILTYAPVDAAGEPVPWGPEAFVLPLRLEGQQLLSVVNATVQVERETTLTAVRVNAEGFEDARRAALDSEATMVRDTDQGLRYLVKEEGVEGRVVQEDFDTGGLFALGGVFYDDALDFPLPIAGVNYLDFDFRGTGNQLNVFFGGALLTADYANPRAFGSRVDVGADLFAFAVPLSDSLYSAEEELVDQEVEARPANVSIKAGTPLGQFVKLDFEYELSYFDYGRTEETAESFVLPEDHFLHAFELSGSFAREGYRLNLAGSYNTRSAWEPWGLPGSPDYDPDHEDFLRWQGTLEKSWFLPNFQRIGAEIGYYGGSDLDRFSKYQFGFFGGTSVHGYQSGRVRAEEAWVGSASYGLEIAQTFRLELVADYALATDPAVGFDQEPLAGVGLVGTVLGPWETIINMDVGVPVEGPDDGFVAYIVFLKLFDWEGFESWIGGD